MGREIKRVPLDFDWPLNERWSGYLTPDKFNEIPCEACAEPSPFDGKPRGTGWSPRGKYLYDLWYGQATFVPAETGSSALTPDHPVMRARAVRNVEHSPGYYGTGEAAILAEAWRLCDLFNGRWAHHLTQDDVDALVEADRLWDFTRTWSRATGWVDRDEPVRPTAAEVNEWSLQGMGHDSINGHIVVKARCAREGVEALCSGCNGDGSLEAYEGQRDEADRWRREEPPTGDGWQLWETVSEGSPISPVFATAEGLAQWLTTPASCWGATKRPMTIEQARGFVGAGWAPSGFITAGGVHDGAEFVGTEAALKGHESDGGAS